MILSLVWLKPLRTYTHTTTKQQAQAADAMGAPLPGKL